VFAPCCVIDDISDFLERSEKNNLGVTENKIFRRKKKTVFFFRTEDFNFPAEDYGQIHLKDANAADTLYLGLLPKELAKTVKNFIAVHP